LISRKVSPADCCIIKVASNDHCSRGSGSNVFIIASVRDLRYISKNGNEPTVASFTRPEPLEITAPFREVFKYIPKASRKSERGESFLTGNSSIYSLSPLKPPERIQLAPTPHPSTRPSSYGKRRGPFTYLSPRDFGTSKKGKELENAPGSMASHSMISTKSDDILQVSSAPLCPILNPQEANDLEILIAFLLKEGLSRFRNSLKTSL
jgi:hypothetical protein